MKTLFLLIFTFSIVGFSQHLTSNNLVGTWLEVKTDFSKSPNISNFAYIDSLDYSKLMITFNSDETYIVNIEGNKYCDEYTVEDSNLTFNSNILTEPPVPIKTTYKILRLDKEFLVLFTSDSMKDTLINEYTFYKRIK
jgi:hypothetical protein